jgi:2-keto-4-pentenoate hydratase
MNDRSEAAARELVELRRRVGTIASLPDAVRPRTLAEGYAIQRRATALWGDRVAGWKVGATSAEVQALFRLDEPVFGPVFAKTVITSPARVPAAAFQHRIIESEFTFRMGSALPPRAATYAHEEIAAAVDAVIPSFEIISPRFTTLTVGDIPQLVADFGANGGAVLGQPFTNWLDLDLPAAPASLSIGSKSRQQGTGAIALGSPLNVLVWLVNRLSTEGVGIAAGQFVMTGTVTGVHSLAPGDIASTDFGALGTVETVFTSA